jgi:hypothetical protein
MRIPIADPDRWNRIMKPTPMHKSAIPAAITQEVIESASNAAEKGLSQFFTPLEFGAALAGVLPEHRLTITDLNCGNGQLLQASANETTRYLLGADIDASHAWRAPNGLRASRIQSDLTKLYPLLTEVDWTTDLFVLNPPWRLFWHRDRLSGLEDSALVAVRQAFAGREASAPRTGIDSTIATLLIALDRCTPHGEGMLIANNATLERLLFAPGAPHAAVAQHIWLHLVIPGNPMTGIEDCKWQKLEDDAANQFHTGVIYFARQHRSGPHRLEFPDGFTPPLPELRLHRLGGEVRSEYGCDQEAYPRWQIVRDQVAELHGAKPKTPWNLWLAAGRIHTALSSFESHSRKVDKAAAERLFKLTGQTPMQLVLQRSDREELLHVAERMGWRVQPELLAAVRQAITDYHAGRAPLYPLSDIQRLGYCDEQDWLQCRKSLGPFTPGQRYRLRTQTLEVEREVTRPNATTGEPETCTYSGHELGIFLHSAPFDPAAEPDADAPPGTREYSFMDAKLQSDKKTTIPEARSHADDALLPENKIDFTLQQLVEHFDIPEVPDVATVNPAGYQANLKLLDQLEQTLAELTA